MKFIKTVFILLAVAVCIQCAAEDILLKDGTKITGQITGVNADKFVVKTTFGEIQVPKTKSFPSRFRRTSRRKLLSARPPNQR